MKHKDDFLSLYSLERNFKNTMPRIWPMTEPEIIRQAKMESMKAKPRSEGDHRLAKRILRMNMRKAVGCQTEPSSSADSGNRCDSCNSDGRYSIPCYRPATDSQQHEKQKRRRHEVGCQTGYSICVLCQIESQPEPDEPYMIKMKQRRQREELQVYYRQMGGPAPSKSHSDRSLRHMRTQLELYLEILAHCDRIVDDKLQAKTKNVSNQC
ncbi:GL10550 [Drosophila persimilis]|uniref:GL10550 n=1 Tax=Drosophila persimilis TaxID=7234 RepID=B4GBB5_DROPE|nr:GL10550 [Drosophila persimilis]